MKKIMKSFASSSLVVISYVIYRKIFGSENAIIGLLFGVGGIFFLNKDFTGKLKKTFLAFFGLNIVLAMVAYVAGSNIYVGLILNFLVLFVSTYIYMNDFTQPNSFIFLMIYIFMYLMPVSLNRLPLRLLAIVIGIILIMCVQIIFKKGEFNKKYNSLIDEIINKMSEQILNIDKNKYNEDNSIEIDKKIRALIISIKEYSSKLDNKFNIALCLYRLNMSISLSNDIDEKKINKKIFFEDLNEQLMNIDMFNANKKTLIQVENEFERFNEKYEKNREIKVIDEMVYTFLILILSLKENSNLIKSIYKEITFSDVITMSYKLKKNFNIKSIKFRYAIRLSIGMSLLIFISKILKVPNLQWLILSTYNVLQPYFEDSIDRGRRRFKGVIIAAILCYILLAFINYKNIYLIIMLITFAGYFYFTEYSKKVAMTSILSITIASVVSNNYKLAAIERVVLLALGIIIAVLINRYIFPYKTKDSIVELKENYKKTTKYIIEEFHKIKYGKGNLNKMLIMSMEKRKLESLLIEKEDKVNENKNEIEKFIYRENLKINKGKYNFLKYYYEKLREDSY